jgi:hypothetical protein
VIKEGEQNPEYNKHLRLEAPLGLTIHTCSAFRPVPNQVGYTARIAIYKKRDIGLLSFPQGQPKKKTTEKKPGLIYKRHPGSLFNQSAKMVKPWTDHRREITRLYITERMTLANVQKAMKERYNFQASIRSYRQHFDQWDLQKYNCKKRSHRRKREYIMKGMLPSPPYTPQFSQSERKVPLAEELAPLPIKNSVTGGEDHDHAVVRYDEAYAAHTPPSYYPEQPSFCDSFGYPPARRDYGPEAYSFEHRLPPPMMHRADPW